MAEPARGGLAANAYLLVAVSTLAWAGNHVVGRAIAGHVPPYSISTLRWLIPAFVLLPFAWTHLKRDWLAIRAHKGLMLLLSITGGMMFSAGQYVGLNYTTAINTSVLNSMAPVLIVAAGALIFRDAIGLGQVVGILTSLAGVIVIIAKGDATILRTLTFNWGDLIILFNMAVWAVYSVYLRKRPAMHPLSFISVLSVIAALTTMPFMVWEHATGDVLKATWTTLLAVLYVSTFPSIVAYLCWNRGVELIGSGRAGAILHLIPLWSALLATVLIGERLQLFHIVGFVLILAGVSLASRAPRTAA